MQAALKRMYVCSPRVNHIMIMIFVQPALSKDVSKFLKGLKLDGTHPNDSDVQPVKKASKKNQSSKPSAVSATNSPDSSNVPPSGAKPKKRIASKPVAAKPPPE